MYSNKKNLLYNIVSFFDIDVSRGNYYLTLAVPATPSAWSKSYVQQGIAID